jgi:hypothetical protein
MWGKDVCLLTVCGYIGWCWYCNGEDQTESRPNLRTGHRGPEPWRQISRDGILKNDEIEIQYAEKGLSTRDKFKGDLY